MRHLAFRRSALAAVLAGGVLCAPVTSLSRFNLKSVSRNPLEAWQNALFILLTRTANDATDFLRIPPGRVVWLGGQLTI